MTMNSDPYVQFCSREDAQIVAPTDMDNPRQPNNANRGKKKTRGFTQMRGIWGIREPTRAELFKHCFTMKGGTQSSRVETAIALMQQKEKETPTDPVISRDDSFAQVMGKDKNGKVRMFGGGVCPSDIFKDTSSRGANQRAIIKLLEDQSNQLRDEVQQLKAQATYVPHHEDIDPNSTQAPDDLSPIIQVANRDIWSLSMPSGSFDCTAQRMTVLIYELDAMCFLNLFSHSGDIVCLKSIIRPSQTIAIGILYSMDPSREVGGQELGHEHWEIYIQAVLKPNERLIRSCGRYTSIGDAAGDYIAWPKCFTILKEIDDARGHESWTVRG